MTMNVGERESNLHPLNHRKIVGSNSEITACSHTCKWHARLEKGVTTGGVSQSEIQCREQGCRPEIWLYKSLLCHDCIVWQQRWPVAAAFIVALSIHSSTYLRNMGRSKDHVCLQSCKAGHETKTYWGTMMLAANHQTQLGFPTERITWWQKANIGWLSRKA